MRIAHVASFFQPHTGGIENHVGHVAGGLAASGHDVTVITSATGAAPLLETRDGYRIERLERRASPLGAPVVRGLGASLRRGGFDVVHVHTPPPLMAAAAAARCRRLGVPVVLTHHCDAEARIPLGRMVGRAYEASVGRWTRAASARVLATSRSYASTSQPLASHGALEIVPNGVDTGRFSPSVVPDGMRERLGVPDGPVFLFVGRLVPHKGLAVLIEASAQVEKPVSVVVVGEGPERKRLERRARALGAPVYFAGFVPDDALPRYYAGADAFVLPSTGRLEGFGISLLEGMSTGLPAVVSAMPGPGEVVDDGCGLKVAPGDIKGLAAAMGTLADDRDLRSRMGRAARARVLACFDIDDVVRRLERHYADILEASRPGHAFAGRDGPGPG